MGINRNNYEEFFLMYVDNELSAEERSAVEGFVQQNPDLQSELDALQLTVAAPEHIMMPAKEQLLRTNDVFEDATYQEKFLLYVDKELNPEESASVEKFVLQHPEHQEEFLQLKNTVLPLETISFPGKESLYKRERKGRVVMLAFQRVAVAAVLFGLIAGGWWMFVNPGETEPQPAGNGSQPIAGVKVIENKKADATVTKSLGAAYNNQTQPVAVANAGDGKKVRAAIVSGSKVPAIQQNLTKEVNEVEERDEVEVLYANRVLHNKEVQEMNREAQARILEDVLKQLPNELSAETSKESFATTEGHSTMKVLDVEEEETDAILVGNLQLNKTKIKGMFKKAGRFFTGNKIAENPGKIQIAGFEIERRETRN